ncbi:MAG: hypothetical protein HYZ54_03205 [Ignavibacteriae bacterium]|nr:hypothetical protein [Ignavibacteriota bacterium]
MATTQPFEFRRSRDFGESFSALFEFLRQNWKNLSKSLVLIAGPLILILGVGGGFLLSEIISGFKNTSFGLPDFSENIAIISLEGFVLAVAYFLTGATVLAITNEYIKLSLDGYIEEFDVSYLWAKITSRFWRHISNFVVINAVGFILVLPFMSLMGILVGFKVLGTVEVIIIFYLLFIFVGVPILVYFGTSISLFPMMRVCEDIGIMAGIKRCFFLIKNHFWVTFGYYFVVGMIQGVVGIIFMIPFYIMYFIALLTIIPQAGHSADGSPLLNFGMGFQIAFTVASVIAIGGSLLLNSMTITSHALQYFNLVERKEGLGMMAKLDLLGTPENPSPELDENEGY